jgi:O-antigen biosynthesis protein WbqP
MLNRPLALILLFLFSPIFLIVALLILFEDGFPVFFKQRRVGVNYTFFNIYKLRSMKKNTPNVATHLLDNPEQYLLKIGMFIRKTSLDELPNLINIIKGEMVFVGPRPALFNQEDLMNLRIKVGVDKLKPGITGWAQINGRNSLSWDEKFKLDVWYVDNQSFFLDLKILFLTLKKVLIREGINANGEATMNKFTGN